MPQYIEQGNPIELNARKWVSQLVTEIQKNLIKRPSHLGQRTRSTDMLERRFNLDSLTALTILFRLNHENENDKGNTKAPRISKRVGLRMWNFSSAANDVAASHHQ